MANVMMNDIDWTATREALQAHWAGVPSDFGREDQICNVMIGVARDVEAGRYDPKNTGLERFAADRGCLVRRS